MISEERRDYLYKSLFATITFCGGRYNKIVSTILKDYENEFKESSCAESVHHDYKGGLIEHTYEVLSLCLAVIDIFDNIDIDLLIAGAILHDIGKVFTYVEKGDNKTEKTFVGELEEHLYVGAEKINEYGYLVKDPLDLSLLKHMVLSHHGKREWGSPVVCKTKEADIVHQCDMISSRLTIFDKAISECEEDGIFTKKIPFLEGKVYKGGISE